MINAYVGMPSPRDNKGTPLPHNNVRSRLGKTANLQNTPFSNRRVSLHRVRRFGKSAAALKLLEVLLKRPWNAFSVSPLFTWNSRESKLKRYARRMSTFLAESLSVEAGDKFEVRYKIDEHLKLNGNDDPAVEITVSTFHDGDVREAFLGYLISWGCPKTAKGTELDSVLYLPVLLCSGSKKIGVQVRRALENIHDCVVSSLELRESDRKELWMALLSYLQRDGETITIQYMIPNRPNVGSIDIEMSSDLTTKLSRLIYKKHGRDVSYEEVALFWNEINEFIHDIYGIKVQYCEMTRLLMREATIAADRFRANSVKAMHAILIFLTNMSAKLESLTDGAKKPLL